MSTQGAQDTKEGLGGAQGMYQYAPAPTTELRLSSSGDGYAAGQGVVKVSFLLYLSFSGRRFLENRSALA